MPYSSQSDLYLGKYAHHVSVKQLELALARGSVTAAFYLQRRFNGPTVFLCAGVNLLAANTVSSSGEGQHLDAVVGVFLQAIQLQ